MKRALNIEETMPMMRFTAKLLIGPASKLRRMSAAMMVVTLESMMAL